MFFLIANNLGLDLVNTRIVDNGAEVDLIANFDDLLDWAVAAGLTDKARASKAKSKWSGTSEAEILFRNAIDLRDSLKQMAEDLVHGRAVSKASLIQLNQILRNNTGYFELRGTSDGYEKQFHTVADDIAGLLVPVAESAADLLCFGDLAQVKKCENETCVLHFYDTSKNHRRRWCSMSGCGNRAKAAAFYKRSRRSVGQSESS